jgi:cytoskeletal protein RodZ
MSTEQGTSIGARLSAARQKLGWSIPEAANRTKLKADAIEKIEKDQFDRLPSMAYARGFVRIYARELKVDGASMLREMEGDHDDHFDINDLRPEDLESIPNKGQPAAVTTQGLGLLMIVLVLGAALIIVGMSFIRAGRIPSPPAAVPNAVVAEETAAPAKTAGAVPVAKPVKEKEAPPKAIPVTDTPVEVRKAVPVAEPVEPPKAEPVKIHTLRLFAQVGTPEEHRYVRVTALKGGNETVIYDDLLPEGETFPPTDSPAWSSAEFSLFMRETSGIKIFWDDEDKGTWPRTGVQRFNLPPE